MFSACIVPEVSTLAVFLRSFYSFSLKPSLPQRGIRDGALCDNNLIVTATVRAVAAGEESILLQIYKHIDF